MSYKIFAINPGSTSTKIALFDGDTKLFSKNVSHDAAELAAFPEISDQLACRRDTILGELGDAGISLAEVDAYVGRGGGLLPMEGGVYPINDVLLEHARTSRNGVHHPANLGSQLAWEFACLYGKPAFVVNPPDTDELQDVARMTGLRGVYRTVRLHALNLKETAIRHAKSVGRRYEDCNFIVCHMGGGLSVSAHRRGKMIDGNDIVGGDGPMAPTRCGSLSVEEVVQLCFAEGASRKDIIRLCQKTGGFVSHLGTHEAVEVLERAAAGDARARRVWGAMLYQTAKYICSMAGVLEGKVDAILLGGGMVHSAELVKYITDACSWIAPVFAYPGEFEMEAMAAGVMRVLTGEEKVRTYTGIPVWQGFEDGE